ncbi:MAG: TatD family hydrolase [Roseburia sp.]|nr:TatD family hydrolase [Lachnospiraceae bacterium]MDY4838064.1 TatD family hydrolase [Lachnospiraceae bacterium]
MHNKIFETHAHYEDVKFDSDREELLASLPKQNIEYVINVGSNLETTNKSIELAKQYDYIYAAIGVHPSDVEELDESSYDVLEKAAKFEKTVAIGEIGLDYYWDKEPAVQAKQREWFKRQMLLAKQHNLPVIIHSRDAAEDTMRVMKEIKAEEIPGVIHCYSYSVEMAKEFVKMGYYIGIGGVVTFKNAKKLKEVAAEIPLERILLETDCPYMAPEPHRGERNSSLYLPYVVEKLAEIRNISKEEIISTTNQNARKLFLSGGV